MEDRILEHYLDEFQTGAELDPAEAETLFDALIGSTSESKIAAVLSAWNDKGTNEDELFAMAVIMRERMKRIETDHDTFVDIVGTGGSKAKTFNVSTASAFVTAGSGLPVAKHGNRSATSSSGSADVMTELKVDVDIEPSISERNLNEHGICFLFAPRFHALSKHLAGARRRVKGPTIFNNLGPLCNPASPPHQVVGVWNGEILETTARVLARLGTGRTWVIHAETGLDEISIAGKTHVREINGDKIDRFEIAAPDFGVYSLGKAVPLGCSASESAGIIRDVMDNKRRDTDAERLVMMNAAAAIYVSGRSGDLHDAFEQALDSVRSGSAATKLNILMGQRNE